MRAKCAVLNNGSTIHIKIGIHINLDTFHLLKEYESAYETYNLMNEINEKDKRLDEKYKNNSIDGSHYFQKKLYLYIARVLLNDYDLKEHETFDTVYVSPHTEYNMDYIFIGAETKLYIKFNVIRFKLKITLCNIFEDSDLEPLKNITLKDIDTNLKVIRDDILTEKLSRCKYQALRDFINIKTSLNR